MGKNEVIHVEYDALNNIKNQICESKNSIDSVMSMYDKIIKKVSEYEPYKGDGSSDFDDYNDMIRDKMIVLLDYLDMCLHYIDLCVMTSICEDEVLAKEWMAKNGDN